MASELKKRMSVKEFILVVKDNLKNEPEIEVMFTYFKKAGLSAEGCIKALKDNGVPVKIKSHSLVLGKKGKYVCKQNLS